MKIVRGLLQRLLSGRRFDESDFCDECVDQFGPEVCDVCGAVVADLELHEQWHADESVRQER